MTEDRREQVLNDSAKPATAAHCSHEAARHEGDKPSGKCVTGGM